ncbi:hypothetical protein C1645_839787 [Glomus cerebriforme]|uniref:Uncharacterized protein n=1 Tax=Glomus cerebriforme TaxID=658196 RepID=A0A397S1L1_9GLOM|nr:hypothetical protein C1645_839787 [Glomus cerebriforme]
MSTYPAFNIITLNQNSTHYIYTIIKEGYYPQNSILRYTSAHSCNNTQFKIQNNYSIQISWSREYVESTQSATNVANAYLQLEREHERKHRSHFLKPFNKPSNSIKTKRVYIFSKHLAINFTNTAVNYFHSDNCPVFQEICFTVQNKLILEFKTKKKKINEINKAFTRVIDQKPIA